MVREKERDMYPIIKAFLRVKKHCDRVLIERVTFEEIKKWTIDVVGIEKSKTYAVEAKSDFDFNTIAGALTQAEFYRKACVFVYVCFPKEKFENGKEEEKKYLKKQCEGKGIGLLLADTNKKIIEDVSAWPVKESKELNFDLYHQIITKLTGPYNKKFRKRLYKALGLLITGGWEGIRDEQRRKEEYCKKSNDNVAIETLIFDQFHWPIKEAIFAKEQADEIYGEIKREAFRENKSPAEYLSQKDVKNYLKRKFENKGIRDPPKRYVLVIDALVKKLRVFHFSIRKWYKNEGVDSICKFLVGIKGLGKGTAMRIAISCNRTFGWKLPKNLTLPGDVKKVLEKMGLDEEDFTKEWRPLVDNIAWFLRGKHLEDVYEEYKKKIIKV